MVVALVALALDPGAAAAEAAGDAVVVFAAASLSDALSEIGDRLAGDGGTAVTFSFASSSTLARQIEAGAPADIFASANEAWVDYLTVRGLVVAGERSSPIGNSLVLIAPAESTFGEVVVDAGLDLPALLGDGERLAMGDPDHVPAGVYAREALRALGLWQALEPRLARAGDVRAAVALVERGEAPLGIVYATDAAVTDGVQVVGRFPAASHPPIAYPFVMVAEPATPAARRVFAALTGDDALQVYLRHGFSAR